MTRICAVAQWDMPKDRPCTSKGNKDNSYYCLHEKNQITQPQKTYLCYHLHTLTCILLQLSSNLDNHEVMCDITIHHSLMFFMYNFFKK